MKHLRTEVMERIKEEFPNTYDSEDFQSKLLSILSNNSVDINEVLPLDNLIQELKSGSSGGRRPSKKRSTARPRPRRRSSKARKSSKSRKARNTRRR